MTEKGERNWLIRTRSMQILGPVSLAKVVELIDKGSLRDEDEVTSGNGYWFCIRETELVEKYLQQNIPQGFNPIAEAKSVLTSDEPLEVKAPTPAPVVEEVAPLSDEDLEYPDMDAGITIDSMPDEEASSPEIIVPELDDDEEEDDDERDDVTLVAQKIELQKPAPKVEAKAEPPPPVEEEVEEEIEDEPPVVVQKVAPKKVAKKAKQAPKAITKNDRYLFVLLFLVAGLIFGVIYYYRTILNKPLPGFQTSWLMDSAHAQTAILTTPAKKKVSIN